LSVNLVEIALISLENCVDDDDILSTLVCTGFSIFCTSIEYMCL